MIKTPLSTVIGGAFWTPGATILGSTRVTLDTIIKSLFANGEQGFAYDPNDLTTLYQDAAGTIPVTAAGQPVGLMKDKSGRDKHASQSVSALRPVLRQTLILGNDRVVNGDFSNGVSGWGAPSKATFIATAGRATLTATDVPIGQVAQSIANLAGKTVEVSCDYFNKTGAGTVFIALWSGTATTGSAGGTAANGTLKFMATLPTPHAGNLVLQINGAAVGDAVQFDNVTLKEVTGYRTAQNYLEFDGVDDLLQPASFSLAAPFSTMHCIESISGVSNTQALLSSTASGYLYISENTVVGVQQTTENPQMTISRNKADTIYHKSDESGVLLKTNSASSLRTDLVHVDPYATADKFIGRFNASSGSAASMKYYGGIAIRRSLTESEELALRSLFNKRIGA